MSECKPNHGLYVSSLIARRWVRYQELDDRSDINLSLWVGACYLYLARLTVAQFDL